MNSNLRRPKNNLKCHEQEVRFFKQKAQKKNVPKELQ